MLQMNAHRETAGLLFTKIIRKVQRHTDKEVV
jgi:hypothetical protein